MENYDAVRTTSSDNLATTVLLSLPKPLTYGALKTATFAHVTFPQVPVFIVSVEKLLGVLPALEATFYSIPTGRFSFGSV